MTNPTCPFCALTKNPDAELLIRSTNSVAFYDRFPSAPGHVLVVPTIHVGRLCELPAPIAAELFDVVLQVQRTLQMNNPADAYTIGVNDGPAAGQTIPHVHVHLIPRHHGDTADPRGPGVGRSGRLRTTGRTDRLHLRAHLRDPAIRRHAKAPHHHTTKQYPARRHLTE